MSSIDWERFGREVEQRTRFLLTSHVRPDCDSLGSELGMARVLEHLGKQVRIVNAHPTPPQLSFLDPEGEILVLGESVAAEQLQDIDALMVLDTSAWVQLGSMADIVRTTPALKIVLDHHISGDDLGAVEFKDSEAEATGRLVVEAADHLGVPLTPQMATPLFAAMATDTGWFRFPSVSGLTYRVASRLVEAGAEPSAIFQALYERDSLSRVKLRSLVLSRMAQELEGRLTYTYVKLDDYSRTGAQSSDTEDMVNMALAITGTETAAIFIEQPQGGFKVSLRSRGDVDCSQVAAGFGGGGHRAAAGAMMAGSWNDVREAMLDALRKAMG